MAAATKSPRRPHARRREQLPAASATPRPSSTTRSVIDATIETVYHRELLRTIPHHHGQSAALSRTFLAAPHCATYGPDTHHQLPIEPLAPSLHFMASRISKSIGLLGHCVLIGLWALHVRRFGYRPALRDIFLLTTWIPRSPNHVAQCADGEPHAFSLLILSLLSLYFCLPSLALRNVGMRDNVQYTSESINLYAPETDMSSPLGSP